MKKAYDKNGNVLKVGSIVKGSDKYAITDSKTILKVVKVINEFLIDVKIIHSEREIPDTFLESTYTISANAVEVYKVKRL